MTNRKVVIQTILVESFYKSRDLQTDIKLQTSRDLQLSGNAKSTTQHSEASINSNADVLLQTVGRVHMW